MELTLATTNAQKYAALVERVGRGIRIRQLRECIPEQPDWLEAADTFEAIAATKARWYSRHIPQATIIATDGGLTLSPALSEWSPLLTARFAGAGASMIDRTRELLARARGLHGDERRLGWTEALAVARDGKVLQTWIAQSPPGVLATDLPSEMAADAGFWVPNVWRCPEYGGRRLIELTDAERLARRDHWAILGEQLTAWCQQHSEGMNGPHQGELD